ncbi:unnamed protein product [Prunus armeniaca]
MLLVRTTNNHKDTDLHEAVRFNFLDVVQILTREDPEFSYLANVASETPLYVAVENGYNLVGLKKLRICTYPAYQGPNGKTALHAAAMYVAIHSNLCSKSEKLCQEDEEEDEDEDYEQDEDHEEDEEVV